MSATHDWFGCSTFRLRAAGLTLFLDTYIDRAPGAAGTGLRARRHLRGGPGRRRTFSLRPSVGSRTDNGADRCIFDRELLNGPPLEQAGVPLDRMICVAGGER